MEGWKILKDKHLIDALNSWMGKIEKQLTILVVNRHVFYRVKEIVQSNAKVNKSNSFHDMIISGYVASSVMGIRRLVDSSPKAESFVNLLDKIIKNSHVINRKWFVSLWGEPPVPSVNVDKIEPSMRDSVRKLAEKTVRELHFKRANETFNRFSGIGKDYVDIKKIEGERRHLISMADRIKDYADRVIAHSDSRGIDNIPTFVELDGCVDTFERLCLEYCLLLRGSSPMQLLPTWQYDWEEIFYYPWINKKESKTAL